MFEFFEVYFMIFIFDGGCVCKIIICIGGYVYFVCWMGEFFFWYMDGFEKLIVFMGGLGMFVDF